MRQRFTEQEFLFHSQPMWVIQTRRPLAQRAVDTWLGVRETIAASARRLGATPAGRMTSKAWIWLGEVADAGRMFWQEAVLPAWRRERHVNALDRLDADALRDLGLDRSELRSVVHELHHIVPHSRRRVHHAGVGHPPPFDADNRPLWQDDALQY